MGIGALLDPAPAARSASRPTGATSSSASTSRASKKPRAGRTAKAGRTTVPAWPRRRGAHDPKPIPGSSRPEKGAPTCPPSTSGPPWTPTPSRSTTRSRRRTGSPATGPDQLDVPEEPGANARVGFGPDWSRGYTWAMIIDRFASRSRPVPGRRTSAPTRAAPVARRRRPGALATVHDRGRRDDRRRARRRPWHAAAAGHPGRSRRRCCRSAESRSSSTSSRSSRRPASSGSCSSPRLARRRSSDTSPATIWD